MVYNCEYCDGIELNSFSQLRQHVITVLHLRNKKNRELSAKCLKERMDFIKNKPEDFHKLLETCGFNTVNDIEKQQDFFKVTDDNKAAITKELVDVLLSEAVQFRIMQLPYEMRELFKKTVLESKKTESEPTTVDLS